MQVFSVSHRLADDEQETSPSNIEVPRRILSTNLPSSTQQVTKSTLGREDALMTRSFNPLRLQLRAFPMLLGSFNLYELILFVICG